MRTGLHKNHPYNLNLHLRKTIQWFPNYKMYFRQKNSFEGRAAFPRQSELVIVVIVVIVVIIQCLKTYSFHFLEEEIEIKRGKMTNRR